MRNLLYFPCTGIVYNPVDNGNAASRCLWNGQATATDGNPYNMTYAWFMQMRDGKITNVIAFLDGIRFDDILRRIPGQ